MTSSVATSLCRYDIRISCCLASSRERTMTFFGVPCSPVSTRCTKVLPIEPVPPVTRMFFPSNITPLQYVFCQFIQHRIPTGRFVAKLGPEPCRVQAPVAACPIIGNDLQRKVQFLLDQQQQVKLANGGAGYMIEPTGLGKLQEYFFNYST